MHCRTADSNAGLVTGPQMQRISGQPVHIAAGVETDEKPGQPVATSRPRLAPTEQHLRLLSRRLLEHQKQLAGSEKHASMRRTRQRLPAFKERSRVLEQLQQHGVLVVSGATGKQWVLPMALLCMSLFMYCSSPNSRRLGSSIASVSQVGLPVLPVQTGVAVSGAITK